MQDARSDTNCKIVLRDVSKDVILNSKTLSIDLNNEIFKVVYKETCDWYLKKLETLNFV